MNRWEKEGIVYKRVQGWTNLPHGDECIHVVNNLGSLMVRLDYENGTISLFKRISEDGDYKKIAYFPIEEMEEIVGHMKKTIKKRKEEFEGGQK